MSIVQQTPLSSVAKVQGGFAFKSKTFTGEGIPVLKISNVRHRIVDTNHLVYVSQEIATSAQRYLVNDGDILISMTGSGPSAPASLVGRVARYSGPDGRYLINQRVGRIVVNEALVDRRYIYYCLSEPAVQQTLVSIATGSANQVNISGTQIESLAIPLQPLPNQRRIVEILGTLDDKIELIRKTNETLEKLARTTFKSWFIDFDPVIAKQNGTKPFGLDDATASLFPYSFESNDTGKVPKGWQILPTNEIFEINPKYSLIKGSDYSYTEMADLPTGSMCVSDSRIRKFTSGSRFTLGDTLIARITPCLENGKTAFVDYLNEGEIGWGSTEFIVMRSRSPYPLEASYLLAREEAFRTHLITNMTGSSGRQRVPESCFSKFYIAKPTAEVGIAFRRIVEPIFQMIRANTLESITLASTRDLLLPRLLSGELLIKDAK